LKAVTKTAGPNNTFNYTEVEVKSTKYFNDQYKTIENGIGKFVLEKQTATNIEYYFLELRFPYGRVAKKNITI
jgi:hypothetical protein